MRERKYIRHLTRTFPLHFLRSLISSIQAKPSHILYSLRSHCDFHSLQSHCNHYLLPPRNIVTIPILKRKKRTEPHPEPHHHHPIKGTMLFTRALILSTFTILTTAQTPASPAYPTTLTPAQQTRAAKDLVAYQSSIALQPEFTSILEALQSAIPESVLDQMETDPSDYLQSIITGTAQPSWYSAIPTSYQNYLSSVGAAEASIISKDAEGPAPTKAPGAKVVVAALAVGAAGLAML